MARFPGFCGGTYTGESMTPAGDRCINWMPERTQGAGAPENNLILVPTGGLSTFATLPGNAVPALYTEPLTLRAFGVSGGNLYEMTAGGAVLASYGSVGNPPYSFSSNNASQMTIAGNGTGYLFNLSTNVLAPILSFAGAAGFPGVSQFGFLDDYFISLTPNSREFQWSNAQDGTNWQPLNFNSASGGADNILAMNANHDELWFMSGRRVEIYINTGATPTPIVRLQGAFMETGIAAAQSLVRMDNTLYWLGADERGAGVVWSANGYSPQRVSNHSVEYFFREYARSTGISDAIGYSEQVDGHSNYVLHFPTATCEPSATGGMVQGVRKGATWVFDRSTGLWHERAFWNAPVGIWQAHLGRCHCYAFGKHLVGDYQSGNVYEMADDYYDDAGARTRRVRRAPHMNEEGITMFYPELALSVDVGEGNAADPNPMITGRMSKDGGKTWGRERARSLGRVGQYKERVRWLNNGSARRAGFEVSTTARVPVTLIDAFLPALAKGTS